MLAMHAHYSVVSDKVCPRAPVAQIRADSHVTLAMHAHYIVVSDKVCPRAPGAQIRADGHPRQLGYGLRLLRLQPLPRLPAPASTPAQAPKPFCNLNGKGTPLYFTTTHLSEK